MGKRHLTPREIMAQCKAVARETRMCERSPWTAVGIICAYTLLKSEGFKAQRIVKVTSKIDEMDKQFDNGEITLEELKQRLMDKAEWSIECKEYTEEDIKAKKGTYQYWITQKQIEPQNVINSQATKYLLFMYNTLIDEFGYGKDRLTRVQEKMNELFIDYQKDKTTVSGMCQTLLDETGIVFELPIDPLTQEKGSNLTGF